MRVKLLGKPNAKLYACADSGFFSTQKTDRRDAAHLMDFPRENRFPGSGAEFGITALGKCGFTA